MKRGPAAQFALGPHAPAVRLHDVFYDREPQPCAAGFTRARLVYPIKAFEDALQMFRGDARSKILHRELDLRPLLACAHANPLAALRVFERILNQVAEDLR